MDKVKEEKGTPMQLHRPEHITVEIEHLNELRTALGWRKLSYAAAYNLVTEKFIHAEIEEMKDVLNDKFLK